MKLAYVADIDVGDIAYSRDCKDISAAAIPECQRAFVLAIFEYKAKGSEK